MTTMTATALRKNLFEIFNNTVKFNETIQVPVKTGSVVILSEEDYRGMLETAYLHSDPQVVRDILNAMHEDWTKAEILEDGI